MNVPPPFTRPSLGKQPRHRKIIQVSVAADEGAEPHIVALCNDGTLWILGHTSQWIELPSIPQPHGDDKCPR